jgi:hypothetical protein
MDLTISISETVAAKLRERASASGEALPAYASKLVTQAAQGPTLEELLAPVQSSTWQLNQNRLFL